MRETRECSGQNWDGWRYYPCRTNARHEHNGKWYCKRHHPLSVREKSKKRQDKIEAQIESSRRDFDLRAAEHRVAEAVLSVYKNGMNLHFGTCACVFCEAVHDLRRLKGEG